MTNPRHNRAVIFTSSLMLELLAHQALRRAQQSLADIYKQLTTCSLFPQNSKILPTMALVRLLSYCLGQNSAILQGKVVQMKTVIMAVLSNS